MRMFLVGMCDIFLLLYLTAVAQYDARPISILTVKDYAELKTAHSAMEQEKSELEKEAAKSGNELAAALKRLRSLEEENASLLADVKTRSSAAVEHKNQLERAQLELAGREKSIKSLQEKLAALEVGQKAAVQTLQLKEEELIRAEKEAAEHAEAAKAALSTAEQAAGERRKFELLSQEATASADAQRLLREKAEAQVREALAAAGRAEEEAREAAQEAELARRAQTNAELIAQAAARRQAVSELERKEAQVSAQLSRQAVLAEARRARRLEEERLMAEEKIKAITQPAHRAYEGRVAPQVANLVINTSRRGLLGTSEEKKVLAGVGAGFAGECVMFMPLEQTGLNVDRDELESLVIESDGHRAHAIYLSRGKPWIVGFAFGTGGVCAERAAGEQLGAYMPTLIAVRNGARLGLGDRLRNVNEAHFVFQRDRLSTDARGFLRYRAEGLRGTSDFAQYLVPGDQIVDLEGRFIGLAPEENMVVPIRSLSGWRKTGLTHVSAKNALAALGLPKE